MSPTAHYRVAVTLALRFSDYDVFGVINGWQPAEEEATLKFSSQLSR
jgi:hypothetical protein